MSELPKGWIASTLATVGEIITGNTPSRKRQEFFGGDIPWVKPSDLTGRDIIVGTEETLTESGAKEARVLPKDAVLVSCIGNLGKVAIAGRAMASNQQINSVVFNANIVEPKFGFYYCRTLRKWMEENSSATTISILNKGRFEQAPIIIAPLNEQKRIVAKLDELLPKVEACKQRLEKIPTILKRFRQSVLAAAVSGKLLSKAEQLREINDSEMLKVISPWFEGVSFPEIPSHWRWGTIGDVSTVKGGKRLPKGEKLVKVNTGLPYIRAGELKNGTVVTDDLHFLTSEIQQKIKRYIVRGNDVYITIVGACIGDAGLIPSTLDGANLTENAAKITDLKEMLPGFLSAWLRSVYGQQFVKASIMSAAQGKLALFRIEKLPIPIPPIDEQNLIIQEIEKQLEKFQEMLKHTTIASQYVYRCSDSLLAKAFSGELVSQDPTDEPASTLLERMKSSSATSTNGSKPKRTRKIKDQDTSVSA